MFKSQGTKDLEAKLYEIVAEEIQNGGIIQGIWAQALAESSGNKGKVESRYIQLRMEQLKREVLENAKKVEKDATIKKQNDKAIQDILNIPNENSAGFKFISIFLFGIGGIGLTLIPQIGFDDDIAVGLFMICLFLVPIGIYGFYLSFAVAKINDLKKLRRKMNSLFWIVIPGSLVLALVGAFSVIIAIVGIILFFRYCGAATRFNASVERALKRNLM